MRKIYSFLGFAALLFVLSSCLEETCDAVYTYVRYEPVVIEGAAFRNDIVAEAPRSVCHPSGFAAAGDYLFMIERGEGIHLLNNNRAGNPEAVSFLPVTGAHSLIVRDGRLYVNNYVDLLVFDISDPARPTMLSRTEDVFDAYSTFVGQDGKKYFTVNYTETTTREDIPCSSGRRQNYLEVGDAIMISEDIIAARPQGVASFNGNDRTEEMLAELGIGSSLSRFALGNDYLYAVDEYSIKPVALNGGGAPEAKPQVFLGGGAETVIVENGRLYIGSESAMLVFDLSNPAAPRADGSYRHVTQCDPVAVRNQTAYVTLRTGTTCAGGTVQGLNVLDVVSLSSLQAEQSFNMHNPIGLAATDNLLFLCDNEEGLKVFDRDPATGHLSNVITNVSNLTAHDVVVQEDRNLVMVIGPNTIQQFSYTAAGQLTALGSTGHCGVE